MKWFVTGDTHCRFDRFNSFSMDEETAIIILGDVGLNFYLRKKDYWNKKHLEEFPATFYCVRGNHEARPQNIAGMKLVYDEEVQGEVWMEETFPKIKYFKDWGVYSIDGYKTLVIGGAYSVDKPYRLANDLTWFADEQLTKEEMDACYSKVAGQQFDLVLSHTCPYSWRPEDLFLSCVAQSTVDNSMELWMEKLKYDIKWNVWLYGHYHADRIERPHAEIFYFSIEGLHSIMHRWKEFEETGYLDRCLAKSPNYYMEDVWKV